MKTKKEKGQVNLAMATTTGIGVIVYHLIKNRIHNNSEPKSR